MNVATRSLVADIKQCGQDFEWYPTTDEILQTIKTDMDDEVKSDYPSVLDCGAGDGRALMVLTSGDRYAIEKSKPLLNILDRNIFVVGTEFDEQTLIDKKVNVVFSNPPYTEFERWASKIITEANAGYVYLVIPSRWIDSHPIQVAIDSREAKTKVIGSFDFLQADRAARAKVDIVRITLARGGWSGDSPIIDPFKLWFEESFKLDIANTEQSKYDMFKDTQTRVQEAIASELVEGRDQVTVLESLYQRDLTKLMDNYKRLEDIDAELLSEMDVNIEAVRGALQMKIEGLKDLYWQELFDRLTQVTNRLSTRSRRAMLEKLTSHTHIDFTVSNVYAVVIWVIKNSNSYFDDQLIQLVEQMVEQANVVMYKSNQNTFGEENWRYGSKPDIDRYKLEYRIVLARAGGINTSEWEHERREGNGLQNHAADFLSDICTVASNLGFDTTLHPGPRHMGEWTSGSKREFHYNYQRTEPSAVLFEAKAFKNGNLHIKFNQEFMCRLNVEFGRLKGWIKSPKEATEEMNIPFDFAGDSFGVNLKIESDQPLRLIQQ